MLKKEIRLLKVMGVAAPVSMMIGLATATMVSAADGYVTNPVIEVVKTGAGECWRNVGGMTEKMKDCGDEVEMPAAADSDGDGVPDDQDKCPGTPAGVAVDMNGCPVDSDGDGVPDYQDRCPGTPAGAKVDANGCEIIASLTIDLVEDEFEFDSAVLTPAMMASLDGVAEKMLSSRGDESLVIIGHTDSKGSDEYNQGLSERRAKSAADHLISKGVAMDKVSIEGRGERQPVADNSSAEGRSKNRRIDIQTK